MSKKSVVIIGGGFAGAIIAKNLEKKFSVTMFDQKDYFEFTPGVLRTIVQPAHIQKIQMLHKDYVRNTKIINAEVNAIDDKSVAYKKNIQTKKMPFDYLVIASGSSYNPIIKDKNVVAITRAKKLKHTFEQVKKSKKIVVAGGGPVGVELAAEIVTYFPEKKITILNSGDTILAREPVKAIAYAQEFLEKRNVTILSNKRITDFKKSTAFINDNTKIAADLVLLCVGIKPNAAFMQKNFSKFLSEKGFIQVNEYLQLPGHKNIFVAGDVTDLSEEKLAQNAENHAYAVIKNIQNTESKKPLRVYFPKKRTMVISLGKYDGIIIYKKYVMTGIVPGLLKHMIEFFFMTKLRL